MNHRIRILMVLPIAFLITACTARIHVPDAATPNLASPPINAVSHVPYIISTIAGTGVVGYSGDGGQASEASLNNPASVSVDSSGNILIVDRGNNVIRSVDIHGVITTVAGTGSSGYAGDGGIATNALLSNPSGVTSDRNKNFFIADRDNFVIRRVDAASGVITTFAGDGSVGSSGDGGPAINAEFGGGLNDLTVDSVDNLFVTDRTNQVLRKINASDGLINSFAGTLGMGGYTGDGGVANAATLLFPRSVAVDASNNVFVADTNNKVIRKINAVTSVISTIAGTGALGTPIEGSVATATPLGSVGVVRVDSFGDVYFSLVGGIKIYRVNHTSGILTTFAGNGTGGLSGDGGVATQAALSVTGFAFGSDDTLYIADAAHHVIRKVTP